jgi:uncharacterized protein
VAIVVSDTSPLRALAHVHRLDLLGAIYGDVLVPPAVADELRDVASALPPIDVASIPGVRVQAPRDVKLVARFRSALDPGESEAIALALEVGAKIILIDEMLGRAAAEREGIQPVGALGVLIKGKQMGLVAAVVPLMESLRDEMGFFMSAQLYATVKRLAGE